MNDDRRFRKSLPLAFAAVLLTGACAKSGHETHDELPAVPLTVWTAKTELFLEYEPLVAGRESRMAAHLTALETFQPLTEGVVTLRLRMESGEVVTGEAKEAARPGIFRPNVTPAKAGKCRIEVEVRASNLTDRLDGGACQVFADEAAARAAAAAGEEEAAGAQIAFLKEQQWKTDFATAPAVERDAQATVEASGSLVPVAGREARLSAPASGRVAFGETAPVPGAAVRKGQLLGWISPRLAAGSDRPSLEAEMRASEAERVAADSQLARAERLLAAEAISRRAHEDAQARAAVARARASAAAARVAQYDASAGAGSGSVAGRFEIRSPLDGTLVSVEAAPGEMVEEGQALFRVIDATRVWLEARVNEADLSRLEGTKSAWFTVEGDAALHDAGRLVSFGRVVDPETRTVPVLFEVSNADGGCASGRPRGSGSRRGPPSARSRSRTPPSSTTAASRSPSSMSGRGVREARPHARCAGEGAGPGPRRARAGRARRDEGRLRDQAGRGLGLDPELGHVH